MARIAGPGAGKYSGLYEELRQRERDKYARYGRVECGDGTVFCRPRDLLDRFEACNPVELSDWQVPRWARGDRVRNIRVRIYPDGRIESA